MFLLCEGGCGGFLLFVLPFGFGVGWGEFVFDDGVLVTEFLIHSIESYSLRIGEGEEG